MSPKAKPTLNYQPRQKLPKLGAVKNEWNLRRLYYQSASAPQFKADVTYLKKRYAGFVKRWRGSNFTESTTKLLAALKDYERLSGDGRLAKPGRYLSLRLALNSDDTVARKAAARLENELRPLKDAMVFFRLALGQLNKQRQTQLLKDAKLAPYRYFLTRVFVEATYNLTEAEEKIINLKASQSYSRWVEAVDTILSQRFITFAGKRLPLPTALESLTTYPLRQRKKLWALITTELKTIGEFAEHEFNAIITDVRTEEKLRGYKKPYSATAISYEDDERGIETLLKVMSSQGFALSKKFYRLKASYHGVKTLHYAQKYDPIGPQWQIPYQQAVTICRDVFYGLKTEYGELFDRMLTHGQIDVWPKPGRRGGAFMSAQVGQPTQVFLNHTNDLTSLRTLAHELGHAIHAERSKARPPLYEGHSITTAETASTLFENLLFNALMEQASDTEKIYLRHDRLAQNTATMQRQIAFFNCELEIHNTISQQGAMTNAELAACMQRHLQSYLGAAVTVTPADGYSYVYVSHLRYGFYVYTYCFGLLMSTLMAARYRADKAYIKEIDRFLSSGGSDTVAGIFRSIGIDVTKPDIFEQALKTYSHDLNAFAKVVKAKRQV